MTDKEIMQMALDALRKCTAIPTWPSFMPVIKDLEARLAQPEPEPNIEEMAEAVHNAYLTTCDALGWDVRPENRVPYAELTEDSKELDRASVRAVLRFTASPQREWKGLTDEEIDELAEANLDFNWKDGVEDFARAIEAKLKEKNG